MRPNSLRLLLSTSSLAALAAFTGTAIAPGAAPAQTISGFTSTPQTPAASGTLSVTNAGTIEVDTGGQFAVTISNSAVTVNNSGQIKGGPSTGGAPIRVITGGNGFSIVNNGNGIIESENKGDAAAITIVNSVTGTNTITNKGRIDSISTNAGNFSAISILASISGGGNTLTIDNTESGGVGGVISSRQGNAISIASAITMTGAINNTGGTIQALNTNSGSKAAILLDTNASVTGGINNAGTASNTGLIQGDGAGPAIQFNAGASANVANTSAPGQSAVIKNLGGAAGGAAILYNGTATSTITNQGPLAFIESDGTGASAGAIVVTGAVTASGAYNIINSNIGVASGQGGQISATGSGAAAINIVDGGQLSKGILNNGGGVILANGSAAAAISIIGGASSTKSDITNAAAANGGNASAIRSISDSSEAAIVVKTTGAGNVQSTITNAGFIDLGGFGTGDAIKIGGGGGGGTTSVTVINQTGGSILGSGTTVGSHAINIASAVSAVGSNAVVDNAGTMIGSQGATILVAGTVTPGGGQYGIINRSGGTIGHYASTALDLQATVGGGIDNAGLIFGTVAINSQSGLSNTITNEATGTINGSVAIAQGTFNILGGQVNGNTTGEDIAQVNFNVSPISTTLWSSFDPINDPVGFTTGGNFTLDTGNGSRIDFNEGAVGLQHNLQAQNLQIDAGAALVWNASQSSLSSTITGFMTNFGTLALVGDLSAHIVGGFESIGTGTVGEGSFVSIGLLHDNSGLLTPSLAITGTGELDGNMNLRVYNDYSDYTPAGKHVILTTTGNLEVSGVTNSNGTDLDVDTNSNTAVLHYTAETSANGINAGRAVTMTIARTGYDQIGGLIGDNEQSLGAALEQTGINHPGSALAPLFGWLDQQQTNAPIQDAQHKMLPIANGAALYGSALGVNSMLQSVDARLANFGDQYVDATPGFAGPGSGRRTGLAGAPTGARNGVWLRVSGGTASQGNTHTDAGAISGFSAGSWNVTLGGDREIRDDFRLGLTLGYGSTRATGDDMQKSKLDIRSYQVAAYGAWRSGPWFATGILGGGGNSYEGERTVAFGPFGERPKSDYSGYQFTMKAVAGMELYPSWTGGKGAMIQITPYGSLRYSHLHLDSYTEKDGGLFNLRVDGQGYNQFVPGVGLRVAKPFAVGGLTLLPWLRPEFNFDLVGEKQKINAAFAVAPDSGFTTEGIRPARTTFSLGFGVNVFTKGNFSASLAGEYLTGVGSDYKNLSGFAQMRFQF